MMMRKMNASPPNKGQGALEYLLLIGGAVLVATVVLVIILSTSGSTNTIISNNISTFQHQISLNAGTGGGGGAVCGNGNVQAGEACDDGDTTSGDGCSSTCTVESGYSCAGNPSVCTFTGAVCGNGNVQAGEACDDGDTSPGDGCDGSCNIESGWTCSGNPSVCNPIPPVPPAFSSFTAATGVGSGQLGVNWSVTNFDVAGPNEIKGWTSDPGITTPAQFDSAPGAAFTLSSISTASGSNTFTGLTPNVGYFIYMKACNTASCTLSPLATTTSSYSSIVFEAELFNGQPGENCLRVVPGAAYSAGNALAYDGGSCGGTLVDGTSTYSINIDPAVGPSTPFKVMVRAFKAAAPGQPFIIEGTSLNIIATNPPLWRPAVFGSNIVNLSGGSNAIDIAFSAAGGDPLYAIDAVLFTTDTACAPANVSPNFEDPCA